MRGFFNLPRRGTSLKNTLALLQGCRRNPEIVPKLLIFGLNLQKILPEPDVIFHKLTEISDKFSEFP